MFLARQVGTDRVCGMDEFCVEVVNVAEEAEHLKEAAKAAAKPNEKEGDEEQADFVLGIPCHVQVKSRLWCCHRSTGPRVCSKLIIGRETCQTRVFGETVHSSNVRNTLSLPEDFIPMLLDATPRLRLRTYILIAGPRRLFC